jgi:hypothetical protein
MFKKNPFKPVLIASILASSSTVVIAQNAAPKPSGVIDMTNALPNAKAGQCFAKVMIPAKYDTVTEKVVTQDASSKIEIIPAKYTFVEENVVIKAASQKIVEVPATYKSVKEKVLISPERFVWRKNLSGKASNAPSSWVASALSSGVPSTAEVGQCFNEYHQPAKYKTVQEKILKREASSRIEIIPATYKPAEQKVLVKEASEKIVNVPATYETTEEKILIRAAYTAWKKGAGPIQKLDNSTGEIMCLIEVPAKYKIITKKVLKTAATSNRIVIPAEYKTIKVRTIATAAKENKIDIPAEYQTINKKERVSEEIVGWRQKGADGPGKLTGKVICRTKVAAEYKSITKQIIATPTTTKIVAIPAESKMVKVRKIVTAAQENKIEIPAVYSQVTKRKKVSDEKLVWRQVLCETNTSLGLVTKLQQALADAGFNPGPVDGVMGRQTYVAIDNFQKKNGIESGGLTLRTLEALKVSVN